MSNVNDVNRLVSSYIKKANTDYAIMIYGDWGCGKTYYVKHDLERCVQEASQTKQKLIYVSLYGIQTLKDIDSRIFYAINPVFRWTEEIASLLSKSNRIWGKIFGAKVNDMEKVLTDFKKYVFVFDDLERISQNKIETNEVLGYINEFCEQRNLKVIVICNEEKTSNIKEFKEKTIRFSIHLQVNIESVFNSIADDKKDSFKNFLQQNKGTICEIFNYAKCQNFRTLQFVLDILEELYQTANEHKYKDTVLQKCIYFVTIYSIEYKNGSSLNELDGFALIHFNIPLNSDNDESQSLYNKYERFVTKFEYQQVLADFIVSGILKEDAYHSFLNEEYNKQKQLEETEEGKICSTITSVNMHENEFNDILTNFLNFLKNGKLHCAPSYLMLLYGRLLEFEDDGIENFVVTDEITNWFKKEIDKSHFCDQNFVNHILYNASYSQDELTTKYKKLFNYALKHNTDLIAQEQKNKAAVPIQSLFNAIENNDLEYFRQEDFIHNISIYKTIDVTNLLLKLQKAEYETIQTFVEYFLVQFQQCPYFPNDYAVFFTNLKVELDKLITNTTNKTLRFRSFSRLQRGLETLLTRTTTIN